jgi:outer membrane protein assembly factor BamB
VHKFLLKIILVTSLVGACSLDNKSGIWTDDIKKDEIIKNDNLQTLFEFEEAKKKEFNTNLLIDLKDSFNEKKEYSKNNNDGQYKYEGSFKRLVKFKFSKIDNFEENEPDIILYQEDIIFFDNSGTLIRFDKFGDKVWKSNQYSKTEKKSKPFLFLANNKNILIVADNLSKYYAINIDNGKLLWSKNNSSPFNSQIKIFDDKFFIVDYENVLHCYSLKSGSELWSFKTDNELIKSQKKLSIIIDNNIIYFNNSIGDITALDIVNGRLKWQIPTQNNNMYAQSFFLKNSDLVLDKKSIYFSNNKNEFFSINSETGLINWKQKINSFVRPVIVNNLIITVSSEGFLIIMEKGSGNIIRITDIFDVIGEKKRSSVYPINFVIGANDIFLTTTNGKLIIVELKTGKNKDTIKIDSNKISKPFIKKNNLYIIKNKAILRFN